MQTLTVFCSWEGPTAPQQFHDIREWVTSRCDTCLRNWSPRVVGGFPLEKALARSMAAPDTSVVVVFDESAALYNLLSLEPGYRALEIVVKTPPTEPGYRSVATASLLASSRIHRTENLLAAVRKAIVRLRNGTVARVTSLETPEQFIAYFRLRYRVYTDLHYIPREKRNKTGWDVDFKDRGGLALGAFSKPGGQLIGCARLLGSLGEQSRHERVIAGLLRGANDEILVRNFEWPKGANYPFDLLESFPGFSAIYRALVRNRITHAEVSRVIVDPEFRGRGLGEAIVDSLITIAEREKVAFLFLACVPEQAPFYRKCGFETLEGIRCDSFYEVNVGAIAMARDLSGARLLETLLP